MGLLMAALLLTTVVPQATRDVGASRTEPRVGAVRALPAMQAARAAHTATTLPDGRVLIVGGFTRAGTGPGTEFFDPSRGAFAPGPSPQVVRHSHTATRLDDGRVLIAGGYGDDTGPLASAEIYDPRTNRFASAGAMGTARANHVAVPLRDGQVLLVGGLGEGWTYLDRAELFDPVTERFTPLTSMTVPREGHAAALLVNGQVLITGGHTGPRRNLTLHASAEIFDPQTRTFRRVGDMTIRRHKHDAVRLSDGRVLVTGGSDERDGDGAYTSTDIFDPQTRTFAAGPAMRHARYKHLGTSLVLPDGRVLVAGGASVPEVFDPGPSRFVDVPSAGVLPGLFSAIAPIGDGGVFISGGYGLGQPPSARAWTYVPTVVSR